MKYNDYLRSCAEFAKDTKGRASLDPYKEYSTDGAGGWQESCDNAHGGLNIKWAFHLTASEIEKTCPQEYANRILERWQCAVDNGCDAERHAAEIAAFG